MIDFFFMCAPLCVHKPQNFLNENYAALLNFCAMCAHHNVYDKQQKKVNLILSFNSINSGWRKIIKEF